MELDPSTVSNKMFATYFIRIRSMLHIINPENKIDTEKELAVEDGISKEIFKFKYGKNRENIDAGQVIFIPPALLLFLGRSSLLGLPMKSYEKKTRQNTVQAAQAKFPEFKVEGKI